MGKNKNERVSFEQWCVNNDRIDLLNLWDYEKNIDKPSDISAKSEKLYWIKCPTGRHESELKHIYSFAYGKAQQFHCVKCESFAQHVIDKYGEEYLKQIWHHDNTLNPWEINYKSAKKIILFDEKYPDNKHITDADHFFREKQEYHAPKDDVIQLGKSLGDLHPECIGYWSDKNDKTPFDYHTCSEESVWWKCHNGVHNDFLRKIVSSKARGFTCPTCGRLGVGLIDLTGQKFSELTVVGFDKSVDGIPYWWCDCSCGAHVSIRGITLRLGNAKTCGNRTIHYSGENNPFWKGGGKNDNQTERSSKKYFNWRNGIIDERNSICVVTGEYTDKPNLHHIYSFAEYPEYRYEKWNSIILDDKYHNMYVKGSFHNIYGVRNNTPQQLEEYINMIRKQLGINSRFNIEEYMNCEKLNT